VRNDPCPIFSMLAVKNGWVNIVSHDFMRVLGASKQAKFHYSKKNSVALMCLVTGHGMTQVYYPFFCGCPLFIPRNRLVALRVSSSYCVANPFKA